MHDHAHKDKFKLSRDLPHNFNLGLQLATIPKASPGRAHGHMFDRPSYHETKLSLGYKQRLSSRVSLKPGVAIKSKRNSTTYEPSIKLPIAIAEHLNLQPGYKVKHARYAKSGKASKTKQEWGLALNYKIRAWKLGWESVYIKANKPLYNHKKHDYKHIASAQYQATVNLAPYLELRNVSSSSKSSTRQLETRVGVAYGF